MGPGLGSGYEKMLWLGMVQVAGAKRKKLKCQCGEGSEGSGFRLGQTLLRVEI